jgi:periplasmic copper chaperone A
MKKFFLLALLIFSPYLMAEVSNDILVEGEFARPALKDQLNSILYMQIANHGSDAALVSASTDAAKIVELHAHVNDNGVMRMRKIEKIDLPEGQKVMLKPGGMHVMLIGLNRDLLLGESVDVTLEFSDGSKKLLTAPVARSAMQRK